jgi:cadmium resistance protein CadD (predicted permease)
MKDKLLNWLNLVLVADVFLVILGFLWFAAAVVGNASGINLGLDLWHKLWIPLFNPAIGILMGALLSGITSWVSKKFMKDELR